MTAFPTTALVPKLAVFCNRLRNLDGMPDPSFFPEITLFTLSGVVNLNLVVRSKCLSNSHICV